MKVRDLIKRVQTADFLSPTERIAWLKKMPDMEMKALAVLASVFDWLDAQKVRMAQEKEQVMGMFKLCLAGINEEAAKMAKKEVMKKLEKDFEEKESFDLEKHLTDATSG